jgi:hypothetical protein
MATSPAIAWKMPSRTSITPANRIQPIQAVGRGALGVLRSKSAEDLYDSDIVTTLHRL